MITIEVNGEEREVPEGHSVAQLLAALGLPPELVAVEVNRRLVARERREQRTLEGGDRVEVVTLVGGG